MITTPQIRIRTEGFRAIKSADIIINGITVVAGENGCGKSTVSKLLYYLYKTASSYNELVANTLTEKLSNLEKFLEIVQHEIFALEKDRSKRDELRKELFELTRTVGLTLEEQEYRWLNALNKTANFYYEIIKNSQHNERIQQRVTRLRYILSDLLNKNDLVIDTKAPLPFDKVIEAIESLFKGAYGKIQSRPISIFSDALTDVFNDENLPRLFEVFEFEDRIITLSKNHLSIPYLIQNVIYIDTPMIVGMDYSSNYSHWNDLNELLVNSGKSSSQKISKTISDEIINGDVSVEDNPFLFTTNDFLFKRADGSVFNLLDCATGIKSFSIIQLLIKNGALNNKTLLIIDEPESHLHPQWIIEYARLIVLLNKEIGIKFFIASHNPDMVSAIKYISEKEQVANNLNFYLAKKARGSYQYDYEHLGVEIDPIFASFNIAIDRINQYGI